MLLIDEIDTLIGDTLIAVLRQLRGRYDRRPESFPQSVVLCGVRDVRDYRIRSSAENAVIAGGSAFNIKAESLRLGDFTEAEVSALLDQHTRETGQPFTPAALQTVWRQTQGQPWLVNALCRRTCFDDARGRDRSRAITAADVFEAQEHLILGPAGHLDQIADKLREDRVRRVVDRDLEYVRDLGLIARDAPPRIANPIYAEIVPRELTWAAQARLIEDAAWYVDANGALDVDKLLIVWPRGGGAVPDAVIDRFVIECKVVHKGLERTIDEGVKQTAGYVDRCTASTGHLVVFDRRPGRSWDEKTFRREVDRDGRTIAVWGM